MISPSHLKEFKLHYLKIYSNQNLQMHACFGGVMLWNKLTLHKPFTLSYISLYKSIYFVTVNHKVV